MEMGKKWAGQGLLFSFVLMKLELREGKTFNHPLLVSDSTAQTQHPVCEYAVLLFKNGGANRTRSFRCNL